MKKKITIKDYFKNPTAASYEAMVRQVDDAISKAINAWLAGNKSSCEHAPVAALSAIGITPPKGTRK